MIALAEAPAATPPSYPCTWPGCLRVFTRPLSRTHHLSSVHGERSSALEAVGRQERRDQRRTVDDFRRHFRRAPNVKRGPLDAGEVEYVRRRILFVAEQLARELRREAPEVAVTIFDLCAVRFDSRGLAAISIHPERAWGTDTIAVAHAAHKSGRRELRADAT